MNFQTGSSNHMFVTLAVSFEDWTAYNSKWKQLKLTADALSINVSSSNDNTTKNHVSTLQSIIANLDDTLFNNKFGDHINYNVDDFADIMNEIDNEIKKEETQNDTVSDLSVVFSVLPLKTKQFVSKPVTF